MNKGWLQFKFTPVFIFFVGLISILPYSSIEFGDTTLLWLFQLMGLYLCYANRNYFFDKLEFKSMWSIDIFLAWCFICIIRAIFFIESYWDFKAFVSNSLILLIPIIAYSGTNIRFVQSILLFQVRISLPVFILISSLIDKQAYGIYLVPISFFIFFIPVITWRWKLLFIAVACLVIFSDLGARSNLFRFMIPVVLLVIFYLRNVIPSTTIEVVRKLFFIIPIFLFLLAVNNVFNPFRLSEYFVFQFTDEKIGRDGELVVEDLLSDTRTFLYQEVIETAMNNETWIFGRSPARGSETEFFEEVAEIYGKAERYSSEVAILNIFTWTGLIGVLLYSIIFYSASYLAIKKSNNIFCKMIGIYIAMRWMYAWVEDNTDFTLNYFFLWIVIGLCFSNNFRKLTDKEIRSWIYNSLSKKTKV